MRDIINLDHTSLLQSDVILYVNRLNTEESVIPYEYHHFDFCLGKEENSPVENLGQVVFGERIRPGPYKIQFMEDVECAVVGFILYDVNKYLYNQELSMFSLFRLVVRTTPVAMWIAIGV